MVAEGDLVVTNVTFAYGAYKGGLKDTLNLVAAVWVYARTAAVNLIVKLIG